MIIIVMQFAPFKVPQPPNYRLLLIKNIHGIIERWIWAATEQSDGTELHRPAGSKNGTQTDLN